MEIAGFGLAQRGFVDRMRPLGAELREHRRKCSIKLNAFFFLIADCSNSRIIASGENAVRGTNFIYPDRIQPIITSCLEDRQDRLMDKSTGRS